ncbi:DUF6456 domain-containing protein [Microvirga pudoricolor]|uniref:DUF6456 domain-containing protein n=1 Tax=Microvirga pudoricolor TaxID=2778729 RepID=UPI001951C825|nr:DUF6456 domain-containing protein [Microvirga pudoricolor]MBM6592413.1 hypothetical protein [Microvirga pudoricolor]
MNKNGDCDRKAQDWKSRPSHGSGKGGGAGGGDSGPLPKGALRLLRALGQEGGLGRVDPVEEGAVLVSRAASGLSVSAGRFPTADASLLERRNLVEWTGEASRTLRIMEAGRAHLRRRAASDRDPEGDSYRAQHGRLEPMVVLTEEGRGYLLANQHESPLQWLRRRKGRDGQSLIDEASYQAGERLRVDITLAGMLPGVTSRWEAPSAAGPSAPGEATDRMIAARQRVRHAFDAVGADFGDLLTDLCGFLKGLELIERERRWPPRSAKVVVGLALKRLAEHYGLEASARGPAASRGIRAWQAVVIEGGRTQR